MIIVYATLHFFSIFLLFAEDRPGVVMFDPILDLYDAIDLSLPIFFLTYVVLLAALIALSYHPRCFVIALQSYTLMVIFRMISIYLTPIEAPVGIIVLHDPFFSDGNGQGNIEGPVFFRDTLRHFFFYI